MIDAQKLKPGWKIVTFGDVVKNANLVERDPEANGIERIVGLEHIDPENLHIRRWNSPENGTSFTRKFVPGQIGKVYLPAFVGGVHDDYEGDRAYF